MRVDPQPRSPCQQVLSSIHPRVGPELERGSGGSREELIAIGADDDRVLGEDMKVQDESAHREDEL